MADPSYLADPVGPTPQPATMGQLVGPTPPQPTIGAYVGRRSPFGPSLLEEDKPLEESYSPIEDLIPTGLLRRLATRLGTGMLAAAGIKFADAPATAIGVSALRQLPARLRRLLLSHPDLVEVRTAGVLDPAFRQASQSGTGTIAEFATGLGTAKAPHTIKYLPGSDQGTLMEEMIHAGEHLSGGKASRGWNRIQDARMDDFVDAMLARGYDIEEVGSEFLAAPAKAASGDAIAAELLKSPKVRKFLLGAYERMGPSEP